MRISDWSSDVCSSDLHIALVRQSEDSLAVQQPLRLVHGDIPEEGPDGGKPRIAASRAIASRHFNMDEEVADHFGIKVGDAQARRRLTRSRGNKANQKPERIAISRD